MLSSFTIEILYTRGLKLASNMELQVLDWVRHVSMHVQPKYCLTTVALVAMASDVFYVSRQMTYSQPLHQKFCALWLNMLSKC